MKVAIHQPHYFPWIGYFDKMAKADAFVLMDTVQDVPRSYMNRNRVIDSSGNVKLITISGDTKHSREKEYREIQAIDIPEWTQKHWNMLQNYYRKATGAKEIFPLIEDFLSREYPSVCQWTCASIDFVRQILDIRTPLIYQSDVDYDKSKRRSELILALCTGVGADVYFSGRGASVDYLDRENFAKDGVRIVFQDFVHPVYPQVNTQEFIPGISILDMLFNCGIEESRRIFWENVRSTHEFEGIEA